MKIQCNVCHQQFKNKSGLAGHMRVHQAVVHAASKELAEQAGYIQMDVQPQRFSAELFSVLKGDVHLTGCEFDNGFLVLDSNRLTFYQSLGEAIEEAEKRVRREEHYVDNRQ